jgi:hypothetical protein
MDHAENEEPLQGQGQRRAVDADADTDVDTGLLARAIDLWHIRAHPRSPADDAAAATSRAACLAAVVQDGTGSQKEVIPEVRRAVYSHPGVGRIALSPDGAAVTIQVRGDLNRAARFLLQTLTPFRIERMRG